MKCKVVIKKPNQSAKIDYINTELEDLQEVVGGLIEYPYFSGFSEKGISLIVNEEGRFIDLKPNIALMHQNKIVDYIFGNIIFIGEKETDDGIESESLNDEQIAFINKSFSNKIKCITNDGNVLEIVNI